jgi:uncharacterized oxidoreductase
VSRHHQLRDTAVEVLQLAPPMVQTDLMPGQATNTHGMPLADYIAEVMRLLARTPTPDEICGGRVQFLRRAEADGQMAPVFGILNPGRLTPGITALTQRPARLTPPLARMAG